MAASVTTLPDRAKVRAPEYLTYSLDEVSEMTRIPLATLYQSVHAGALRVVAPNGAKRGWRVLDSELRRFLGIEG